VTVVLNIWRAGAAVREKLSCPPELAKLPRTRARSQWYPAAVSAMHLSDIDVLIAPVAVIEDTWAAIRAAGEERDECFVLWLGTLDGEEAVVDEAFVPPQLPVSSEEGVGYFVTRETLLQLNMRLHATKLRLLAQVHSHPGRAYHSATDDKFAVVTEEGGFSVVVPDFGDGEPSARNCAIYRLRAGQWTRLDAKAVSHTCRWGR
jgi:hypothetical protein